MQGLKQNWPQFTLLVIVNAFVGGMVGLERSIFPRFAEEVFGLNSHSAVLSFIAAFGLSKALANYFAGRWANHTGRRMLLIYGWLLALPVPLLLIFASNWNWVVFANVLLGLSQGLTWSSTVVMKIDLVGEKHRGFAMGLNEFAGYLAVGLMALVSGYLAERYGLRPVPFYLGLGLAGIGLLMSVLLIKDTRQHAVAESQQSKASKSEKIFWDTTWRNPNLGAISQAGFINNLNDGMIWGLLPIFLANLLFSGEQIAWLAGLYPMVWGLGQLFTGKLGDHLAIKPLLFWGMLLQGVVILFMVYSDDFTLLAILGSLLGLGTALVYPNFLSGIAAYTHPMQRAESIGVFRLWRDLGYVFGAVLSGIVADVFGLEIAIMCIGALTLVSALVVQIRMHRQAAPNA